MIDGLARNRRDSLPNASFIGFTGTPIEKTDANTRAVFVDLPPRLYESAARCFECASAQVVISIYDVQRAVAYKATVRIYYESRVAKLGLNQSELPKIDAEYGEFYGDTIERYVDAQFGADRMKVLNADRLIIFEKQ